MDVIAVIFIGLLVIGLLVIVPPVIDGIVGLLGRKHMGRMAFIPEELAPNANPLPEHDPDKIKLLGYAPKPLVPPPLVSVTFKSRTDKVFADWPEPTSEIDIGKMGEILSMPEEPGYIPIFRILREKPANPIQPLSKPPDIPAPSWTPWHPVFKDPYLELPLYTGWLAILNRLVKAAHREEIEKVVKAKQRKESLIEDCERRNRQVEKLAEEAEERRRKASSAQEYPFSMATKERERQAEAFEATRQEQERVREWQAKLERPGADGLLAKIDLALRTATLPSFVPREGLSRFDIDSGILIHEHRFPDISAVEWVKRVKLKSGWVTKVANQKEMREAASVIYPSLCLRLAAEIMRVDDEGVVRAIAINGWAHYTEKSTGQRKLAYCASLFATKNQLETINISAVDPISAFGALKGIAARSLELTPVAPILRLDMSDPRFVDAKEILAKMAEGENLASMTWEAFEHLCRELFERAFASSGAEVKVTQASRDQGVDAIVFDPDPLRGGKIIIQAKRYTNTVDVSAVRDLYGAVINEGAVKGILVTTSRFGPESYSFAKDKPLTLLNGNELLGLLDKHGYKFRINLLEAKGMAS
jgi:restriction system protein